MKNVLFIAIAALFLTGCDIDNLLGPPDREFSYEVTNDTHDQIAIQVVVVGPGHQDDLGTIPYRSTAVRTSEFEVPNSGDIHVEVNVHVAYENGDYNAFTRRLDRRIVTLIKIN